MVRLACFGAGRIGQVHAANAAAHPDVDLVYLVDPVAGPHRDALAARTGASVAEAAEVFAVFCGACQVAQVDVTGMQYPHFLPPLALRWHSLHRMRPKTL